jgi:transcriptional regulator with XRE-family HTH domain
MTSTELRNGRRSAGLTQVQAAQLLGVSQSYLSQLERGQRHATDQFTLKAVDVYKLPPTGLPLTNPSPEEVSLDELQEELAAVGYPGFAYTHTKRKANPAKVVLDTLVKNDVDVRFVEALPWVLETYPNLNWGWLRNNVKLRNVQNRLGYVVHLAKEVASVDPGRKHVVKTLNEWEEDLEDARLAKEGTLCRDSMSDSERDWLRHHRPKVAEHWSLLTTLTPEQLSYAMR